MYKRTKTKKKGVESLEMKLEATHTENAKCVNLQVA